MRLTVEQILEGRTTGRRQSVGVMDVIPILGDDDDTFAPPDVEVGTSTYGSVNLRNDADRPTIVPPGAGWVVREAAQDHAIGGGKLMMAGQKVRIDTAMCIQSTQGGTIAQAKHAMLILPAALRSKALSMRHEQGYSKLWRAIEKFNASMDARAGGHLEYFLQTFQRELDEFVAQFEVLPLQLGAIILINGHVVGIELAPSHAFWLHLWEPLIRVCYGSLAIRAAKKLGGRLPPIRRPLQVTDDTLEGIEHSLASAIEEEEQLTEQVVRDAAKLALQAAASSEDAIGATISLTTVASQTLAGQVVEVGTGPGRVKYASLVAPGA